MSNSKQSARQRNRVWAVCALEEVVEHEVGAEIVDGDGRAVVLRPGARALGDGARLSVVGARRGRVEHARAVRGAHHAALGIELQQVAVLSVEHEAALQEVHRLEQLAALERGEADVLRGALALVAGIGVGLRVQVERAERSGGDGRKSVKAAAEAQGERPLLAKLRLRQVIREHVVLMHVECRHVVEGKRVINVQPESVEVGERFRWIHWFN